MNEGIQKLTQEATQELSPEQQETIEQYFPEGIALSEEEKLLKQRLILEMATGTTNIAETIEKFKQERKALLEKGGYDPEDYIVEKGGTVKQGWQDTEESGPTIH